MEPALPGSAMATSTPTESDVSSTTVQVSTVHHFHEIAPISGADNLQETIRRGSYMLYVICWALLEVDQIKFQSI